MAGFLVLGVVAAGALLASDVDETPQMPALPESAARAIVQHAIAGGEIIEQELETENGRLIYEFELRAPRGLFEVEIDATTGRVLEIEAEE